MRPILAGLITVALFIGVYGYTRFVESVRRPLIQIQEDFSTDDYSLLITRTFDCVGDPEFEIPALMVSFRDRVILEIQDPVPMNDVVEIKKIENVAIGRNSLVVKAVYGVIANSESQANEQVDEWGDPMPQSSQSVAKQHALRVRILRGNLVIADKTAWIGPGENDVTESFSFDAETGAQPHQDH